MLAAPQATPTSSSADADSSISAPAPDLEPGMLLQAPSPPAPNTISKQIRQFGKYWNTLDLFIIFSSKERFFARLSGRLGETHENIRSARRSLTILIPWSNPTLLYETKSSTQIIGREVPVSGRSEFSKNVTFSERQT